MARRSYHQSCALARALDAVGERWTLLIVRDLLLGPLRYGELQQRLPGIGTNLLAQRLKRMERLGLVARQPAGGGHRWTLTETGRGLEPALLGLIRWAMKTRLPSKASETSRQEWDFVAMKALFDADIADGLAGRFQLILNGVPAILEVQDRTLTLRIGSEVRVTALIEMDSLTGWQLATRSLSQDQALSDGRLMISGDHTAARRLLNCFRLGQDFA